MVVDCFRDFKAAAAHVADRPDRPEEPGDHAQGRESRFFGPGEDTNLEAALRLDRRGELRPVGGATHGLGRHGVDSTDAHRVGDGAKPPHGLNGAAKAVRRDDARLGQSFREAEKGFFVEARHRRPAELVIDQEPDRVRADVDDRIGRPVGPRGALGIELKRPRRRSPASERVAWPSRFLPAASLSQARARDPAPSFALPLRLCSCRLHHPFQEQVALPPFLRPRFGAACPASSPARRRCGRTASAAGRGRWGRRF